MTRKRYVRLVDKFLNADTDVPWGPESMVTIVTLDDLSYALESDDGRFLSYTGDMKEALDDSCKFAILFPDEDMTNMAFRSLANKSKP